MIDGRGLRVGNDAVAEEEIRCRRDADRLKSAEGNVALSESVGVHALTPRNSFTERSNSAIATRRSSVTATSMPQFGGNSGRQETTMVRAAFIAAVATKSIAGPQGGAPVELLLATQLAAVSMAAAPWHHVGSREGPIGRTEAPPATELHTLNEAPGACVRTNDIPGDMVI